MVKNIESGALLPIEISFLTLSGFKKITKENGWYFDWTVEFEHHLRQVYQLTIPPKPDVQGVMSLEVKTTHVYIHLIESAPVNVGRYKVYAGIPLNLVAFACEVSFEKFGYGCVKFIAEPELVAHYHKSWGAIHLGKQLMMITSETARELMDRCNHW